MQFLHSTSAGQDRGADWVAAPAANPEPLHLAGSVLPSVAGYRLLRRIGQGRRCTTWLAHDPRQGDIALKLQDRPAAADALGLAREFDIAAHLRHPNVLQVLEHGHAGGIAYVAMEFLPGGDLAARMTGSIGAVQAVAWLRQAAQALAHLHAKRLVHRDVKPANFLLRADDTLVLADFGLVTQVGECDPSARPGTIVGTPRYVSPEQSQGGAAQAAADVYSLGVLFHEMLCGRPPFTGETVMEVLSQHLVAAAPLLPEHFAFLQPLADAMLAKDARSRLPDAGAVLAEIDSLQRAVPACQAPAGTTGKRW
jgi:eukaryotic-like serine/threonine-protein kinase